jgi:hypothetical protein
MAQTGDIYLKVSNWSGTSQYEINSKPYAYIPVFFKNNFELNGNEFLEGETYKLPALYVYLLFCKDTKNKWVTSGRTTIDVGLLLLGTSEIKVAIEAGSWTKASLAVIDMGVGFVDIAVNDVLSIEVKEKYPYFYENWQKISLIYGIGRLTQVGLEKLVQETSSRSKIMKDASNIGKESEEAVAKIEQTLLQEFPDIIINSSNKIDNIAESVRNSLRKHGYSNADVEFIMNINTLASERKALPEDIELLKIVSEECFPIPISGVKMRKVITLENLNSFHIGTSAPRQKSILGYVTKAEDVEIVNAEQLYKDLKLDYESSNFAPNKGFATIEYDNVGELKRSYESNKADKSIPQTLTGMTGSSDKIIPEFYIDELSELPNGAVLKEFSYDGKVIHEYIYDFNTKAWNLIR